MNILYVPIATGFSNIVCNLYSNNFFQLEKNLTTVENEDDTLSHKPTFVPVRLIEALAEVIPIVGFTIKMYGVNCLINGLKFSTILNNKYFLVSLFSAALGPLIKHATDEWISSPLIILAGDETVDDKWLKKNNYSLFYRIIYHVTNKFSEVQSKINLLIPHISLVASVALCALQTGMIATNPFLFGASVAATFCEVAVDLYTFLNEND
jgi:hypothetical protein